MTSREVCQQNMKFVANARKQKFCRLAYVYRNGNIATWMLTLCDFLMYPIVKKPQRRFNCHTAISTSNLYLSPVNYLAL